MDWRNYDTRELCSCDQEFYVLIWNDFLEILLMKKAKCKKKYAMLTFMYKIRENFKKINGLLLQKGTQEARTRKQWS